MINTELLRKTLAHIESHPEEWNQDMWRCRTGMCFAGHAVALAGARFFPYEQRVTDNADLVPEDGDAPEDIAEAHGVQYVTIVARAARLLGLDYAYADQDDLFAPGNDLDDLKRIVARLCEERDE